MIKTLELFGRVRACTQALKNIGIDAEIVDYVEINKYAVKSYNAINGTNFEPQDITKWDKDIEVDLIMHRSPCTNISLVGRQEGADEGSGTQSSLMYETLRIVKKLKPKYVVWENVRNLLGAKHIHNFKAYLQVMEELGYKNYYEVLNASDFGVPQERRRLFTISIREDIDSSFTFPSAKPLNIKLQDLLETNVEDKHYLSNKMIKYISASGTKNFKLNDNRINLDIARPLTTAPNKRAGTTTYISPDLPNNYELSSGSGEARIRRLTPREYWRLMRFSDEAFDKAKAVNSDTQLYKQGGNSIVVPMLEEIFKNLFGGLENE